MKAFLKKALPVAAVLYLLASMGYFKFSTLPPGVIAPFSPEQYAVRGVKPFKKNDYMVYPLAEFSLEARVLATERYRFDSSAGISPLDVAFGWGPMSDSDVLKDISISQSGRFYFWRSKEMPLTADDIARHSANMHLIPANKKVRSKMLSLDEDDKVELSGYLVEETDALMVFTGKARSPEMTLEAVLAR